MKTSVPLLIAVLLALSHSVVQGAQAYFRVPADTVSPPTADATVDQVQTDRAGSTYIVWSQAETDATLIQRVNAGSSSTNRLTSWTPIPSAGDGEKTRLLFAGEDRVLWASGTRWVLFDKEAGTVITNGTWNFPDLNPRKALLRGDLLYLGESLYTTVYTTNLVAEYYVAAPEEVLAPTTDPVIEPGGQTEDEPEGGTGGEAGEEPGGEPGDGAGGEGEAGGDGGGAPAVLHQEYEVTERQVCTGAHFNVYDTNMTLLGTLNSTLNLDRWECIEGTWLIDREERTRPVLRYATLSDTLEAGDVQEIAVGAGSAGGFADHLVVGANAERLVVISTVERTPATLTTFTMISRTTGVLWQASYNGSEHITGFAMVDAGWLLSGINFTRPDSPQFLWLLNYRGWPQQKQHYYDSQTWEFVVQNTQPTRLLHQTPDNKVVLYDLQVETSTSWWDWLEELFNGWLGEGFVPPTQTTFWAGRTSPPVPLTTP